MVVPRAYFPSHCGNMATGERSVRRSCPALAQAGTCSARRNSVSGNDQHDGPPIGRSRPATPAARDDAGYNQSSFRRPPPSSLSNVECGEAALQRAPRLDAGHRGLEIPVDVLTAPRGPSDSARSSAKSPALSLWRWLQAGYDPRLDDDVKSSEPQGVTAGVSIPIPKCRNRRSICLPLLS